MTLICTAVIAPRPALASEGAEAAGRATDDVTVRADGGLYMLVRYNTRGDVLRRFTGFSRISAVRTMSVPMSIAVPMAAIRLPYGFVVRFVHASIFVKFSAHALLTASTSSIATPSRIAPKVPLTRTLSPIWGRGDVSERGKTIMPMGAPTAHAVLLRKSLAVIARERSDRSNLAVKVRWDCHAPFDRAQDRPVGRSQ